MKYGSKNLISCIVQVFSLKIGKRSSSNKSLLSLNLEKSGTLGQQKNSQKHAIKISQKQNLAKTWKYHTPENTSRGNLENSRIIEKGLSESRSLL